jgi:hypothetical protein
MNRVFGKKKAPGPPPPSLGEASAGVGGHIEGMDGEFTQAMNRSVTLFLQCNNNMLTSNFFHWIASPQLK